MRAADTARKLAVLRHYSNGTMACACCGERLIAFLTIDHVNNDGARHRRQMRGSVYRWLERHHYPPGFAVLCFNCNWAKAHGGCPHRVAA